MNYYTDLVFPFNAGLLKLKNVFFKNSLNFKKSLTRSIRYSDGGCWCCVPQFSGPEAVSDGNTKVTASGSRGLTFSKAHHIWKKQENSFFIQKKIIKEFVKRKELNDYILFYTSSDNASTMQCNVW